MRLQPISSIPTIAVVSTFGTAAAAEHDSGMSKPSEPTAMHSMAKPRLDLTSAQQRLTWKDIDRSATAQNKPPDFAPSVGARVPSDIALKPVPTRLGRHVGASRPYDYALFKRELLIVNPTNRKVVDVIGRHA